MLSLSVALMVTCIDVAIAYLAHLVFFLSVCHCENWLPMA